MSELRPDRRILRASDADRERAVDFLRRHSAEGRLDVEELSDRVGKALSAKTLGELDDLTYDLPSDLPLAAPLPPAAPSGRSFGGGLVVSRIALVYLLLFIGLSAGHHIANLAVVVVLAGLALSVRAARRAGRRGTRSGRRPFARHPGDPDEVDRSWGPHL